MDCLLICRWVLWIGVKGNIYAPLSFSSVVDGFQDVNVSLHMFIWTL